MTACLFPAPVAWLLVVGYLAVVVAACAIGVNDHRRARRLRAKKIRGAHSR